MKKPKAIKNPIPQSVRDHISKIKPLKANATPEEVLAYQVVVQAHMDELYTHDDWEETHNRLISDTVTAEEQS